MIFKKGCFDEVIVWMSICRIIIVCCFLYVEFNEIFYSMILIEIVGIMIVKILRVVDCLDNKIKYGL